MVETNRKRTYFYSIFDHLLNSCLDEIKKNYIKLKHEYKNIEGYAEFVNIGESAMKKILAKNVNKKSIVSIVTLLSICDSLNVPIEFNYKIGLHHCNYQNTGYEMKNFDFDRYEPKKDSVLEISEIKKRLKDNAPQIVDYVPKKIPIPTNIDGDFELVDLETADDEQVNAALQYQKALNDFLPHIPSYKKSST